MSTIYVVMLHCGQYEDRSHHVRAAFTDGAKASDYIHADKKVVEELISKRERGNLPPGEWYPMWAEDGFYHTFQETTLHDS